MAVSFSSLLFSLGFNLVSLSRDQFGQFFFNFLIFFNYFLILFLLFSTILLILFSFVLLCLFFFFVCFILLLFLKTLSFLLLFIEQDVDLFFLVSLFYFLINDKRSFGFSP